MMAEKLKVRIGITTKNRPEYLPKCLSSCLAQAYEPKEIVVWDNSDDPDALRQNKQVEPQFPQVRWLRAETEQTLIETRKSMMTEPGCDLFCSIDDDGWFMGKDELALAVQQFDLDPNCAGVAFDILSPDNPLRGTRNPPQPTMHFVGCGHMLRRGMVETVGYYADFPGRYGSEEKDLCIRFLNHGWNMKFLPGVHVWHDKTSAGRDWAEQHRSGTLNDLIFGLVRCPMPELFYYLPGKAVNLILWGLKGGKQERWSGFLGLWDFLRFAPGYWKRRQPVKRETFQTFFHNGRRGKTKPRDWSGATR